MKKFIVAVVAASMALPVYAADLGGRVLNIGSDTTYPPHEFIEDGVVKGCLLYTSPSPRDATLSRMPSSA